MKSFYILWLALIITLIDSKQLIYVQEMFRHGARYPLKRAKQSYLPPFMKVKFIEGELTSQGKHMHYVLGKIIYDKYWKALFGGTAHQHTFSPSMVYVRSTDTRRTIQSAQCQLQGIISNIKPLEQLKYTSGVYIPPFLVNESSHKDNFFAVSSQQSYSNTIPVHTFQFQNSANPYDQGDYLGKYKSSNCPNQKIWRQQISKTKQYIQILNSKEIRLLRQVLSSVSKLSIKIQINSIFL